MTRRSSALLASVWNRFAFKMLLEVAFSLLLIYSASSSTINQRTSNIEQVLTPEEASQVAETFVNAGLNGFRLLRVGKARKDIDTCNMMLTTTFRVKLLSTGEVYEISSVSYVTHADNCKSKTKIVEAVKKGGLTRVQHFRKNGNGNVRLKDISIDQFRTDMAELEQSDIRILSSNYSYPLAFDAEMETIAEVIELHVCIVSTGHEYVINIVGKKETILVITPKSAPLLPSNLLLSLLGGGNYTKIKRVRFGRRF